MERPYSLLLVPNCCVQSSLPARIVLPEIGVRPAGVGPSKATRGVASDVDAPNWVHRYGAAVVAAAGSELPRPELVACAVVLPEIGV